MKRKWVYGTLVTAAVVLLAGCGAGQASVMPNEVPAVQQELGTASQVPKEPVQVQAQAQPQTQTPVPVQSQVQAQAQTPVYGGYHHGRGMGQHYGGGHHGYQTFAACNQCYGSGQCPVCDGSGYYHNAVCPNCTGQYGSCGICNGTGRIR